MIEAIRPPAGDDGYSLLEVLVGASVMSVVTAIATSGIITMHQTAARTESGAQAQTALLAAFHRLDREVRYAEKINAEPVEEGEPYSVTYVLPDGNGDRQCVQLTMPAGGGSLMRRQWLRPTDVPVTPTEPFTAVANDLGPVGTENPFTVTAADRKDGRMLDTLRIRLNSTVGVGSKGVRRSFDLTFSALNTKIDDDLRCLP